MSKKQQQQVAAGFKQRKSLPLNSNLIRNKPDDSIDEHPEREEELANLMAAQESGQRTLVLPAATPTQQVEYRASLQPVYEPKHYLVNCVPIQLIPWNQNQSARRQSAACLQAARPISAPPVGAGACQPAAAAKQRRSQQQQHHAAANNDSDGADQSAGSSQFQRSAPKLRRYSTSVAHQAPNCARQRRLSVIGAGAPATGSLVQRAHPAHEIKVAPTQASELLLSASRRHTLAIVSGHR